MDTNQRDPREDGYIECSECGHTLEWDHRKGCRLCTCRVSWTVIAIRKLRQQNGLPVRWAQISPC